MQSSRRAGRYVATWGQTSKYVQCSVSNTVLNVIDTLIVLLLTFAGPEARIQMEVHILYV